MNAQVVQAVEITDSTNNVIDFPIYKKKNTQPPKYTKQRGRDPIMPIKDIKDISRAKEYFLNRSERYAGQNIRDYTIFALNINMGLRAGDLLHLHIRDFTDYNFERIVIKEQKTRKYKKAAKVITIHPNMQKLIKEYLNSLGQYNEDDYMFGSRKVNRQNPEIDNFYPNATNQPMEYKALWKKMKDLKEELDLNYNIGSHTLRKTFVYQNIKAHPNDPMFLAEMMKATGHKQMDTMLNYCGIGAEQIANVYLNNVL